MITALSDIEESIGLWGFYPGHEVGTFLSELAFAFLGAYIFNWIIVEVPKERALRGYYKAAWNSLDDLARTPAHMVAHVLALTGPAVARYDVSEEEIHKSLREADWDLLARENVDIQGRLAGMESRFQEKYRGLVPILNSFEPAVSVAIADLAAARIHDYVPGVIQNKDLKTLPHLQRLLARRLHEYLESSRVMLKALEESKYTPPLKPFHYKVSVKAVEITLTPKKEEGVTTAETST